MTLRLGKKYRRMLEASLWSLLEDSLLESLRTSLLGPLGASLWDLPWNALSYAGETLPQDPLWVAFGDSLENLLWILLRGLLEKLV